MGLVGSLLGGYLLGVYLYVSSRYFNMNHNDAFSSMRLNTHKNFLRIRVTEEEVRIYPIGLTKIPARNDWIFNPSKSASAPAEYIPKVPLKPHLLEGPIVVGLARTAARNVV